MNGKKIILAITGGVAAYKIPNFARQLIKAGAEVRVVMTQAACQFTTPFTLATLTKYPVLLDQADYPDPVGHVHLADWADLLLVVPATANSLAKFAHGLADNELTATWLAFNKTKIVVPAMNEKMWQNPRTQANIKQLQADGVQVIQPAYGFLAEGYQGQGRMPETDQILAAVQAQVAINEAGVPVDALSGQRVIISAGGTQEPLDPVRYLSNRSSGKMGLAIAHVASLLGAEVTLVRTPSAKDLPVLPQITCLDVQNARQLYQTMMTAEADIVVMAAAVSDYRAKNPADHKMKKTDDQRASGEMTIELVENPDILASLDKTDRYTIGFAAETQNVLDYGRAKLVKKGADMIVANDVSQAGIGFGADDNAAYLITETGQVKIDQQSKYGLAAQIFKHMK
ncbi:bifunctional phosphopantothenoylcysteine decarboxylase/phosphopantothenate--cysteine ligase CoaBC [Aerococcus urinaehominis]|uniref:bifunctional phosphopantothenoylcysteine decarboxylase/phosphopantothenate--cysteine ligase CoaBC n=1 Tax=Aerococcus urinaehominis TaxID=128944 RepID=UPI00399B2636